jgi:hypothetical protein
MAVASAECVDGLAVVMATSRLGDHMYNTCLMSFVRRNFHSPCSCAIHFRRYLSSRCVPD